MADFEVGKKAAAFEAVDKHVKSGQLVGIGSGSTIVYAVQRLAELVRNGSLKNIKCVPTSFQVSYQNCEARMLFMNSITGSPTHIGKSINLNILGSTSQA